jgi:hypothetical protein
VVDCSSLLMESPVQIEERRDLLRGRDVNEITELKRDGFSIQAISAMRYRRYRPLVWTFDVMPRLNLETSALHSFYRGVAPFDRLSAIQNIDAGRPCQRLRTCCAMGAVLLRECIWNANPSRGAAICPFVNDCVSARSLSVPIPRGNH